MVNAIHKQIAIKRGLAHHGQHLPIAWVNGDQGAPALAKQVFHHFLQTDVDRQHHIAPRHGRLAGQAAHDLAAGGDLHLLAARCAMQHRFVTLLNPQLADVGGAAVIARVFAFFQRAFFFLVDAPDVADDMPRQLAIWVVAIQARVDLYARKLVTPGRQPRNFFIAQTVAQGNGLIVLAVLPQTVEAPAIGLTDGDDGGQRINRGRKVGNILGNQLQRIGRIIAGQHHAIAIHDRAAAGRHRHQRRTVAFSLRHIRLAAQHLQNHPAPCQQGKTKQHQGRQGQQAQPEAALAGRAALQISRTGKAGGCSAHGLQGACQIAIRRTALRC